MSETQDTTQPQIEVLSRVPSAAMSKGQEVATLAVTLPAGSAGTPPHRHSGPVFGYVLSGAVRFEVEGKPEQVLRAGESFSEPGGDVIHYCDANALDDQETVFLATMVLDEGADLLTIVDDEELAARAHLRAPRNAS